MTYTYKTHKANLQRGYEIVSHKSCVGRNLLLKFLEFNNQNVLGFFEGGHFQTILFVLSTLGTFITCKAGRLTAIPLQPKWLTTLHKLPHYLSNQKEIQRNLQLRIEEQGRYLQMMFEKQCKSGTETFKASSSAIESKSGVSSDVVKDSPAKTVLETIVVGKSKSGPDQANGSTTVEESSLEMGEKQDAPECQDSETILEQHASEDIAQAPKRPRTE